MPESKKKLVFLGVGQVARALADQAAGEFRLFGTTRSAERAAVIRTLGIEPIVIEGFGNGPSVSASAVLEALVDGAHVVVSFPPATESEVSASRLAADADRIVYISSTVVYGKAQGVINEGTAVDGESLQSQNRIEAERKWLEVGASVIRAPGIYGRGNGLHQRLLSGTYRLPGDGSNYVSRIHVDDLSAMILSALLLNQKQKIFLSGDSKPTTHREIVEWLVKRLNLPFPASMPLEQCHYTQRGNRKVDASKSLAELGIVLKYPTYAEGYTRELEAAKSSS
ncbi:MAG: hypothetical protein IT342_26530 [Candidatus Melainabacteria bacterium]|nr:hypothetical protein [Candidatus Melainabacteria bacterium]